MLLVVEIIMCVYGAIILINGRARLGRKIVTGARARWAGAVLIAPLPLAFVIGGILGLQLARSGPQRFADMITTLACLELSGVILAIVAHLVLVGNAPQYEMPSSAPFSPPGFFYSPTSPSSSALPDVLTVAEAAQYLRVSEAEILIMIKSGRLKAARIGTEWRIPRQAIDDLMNNPT